MTIVEAAVAVVAEGDTDLREEAIITITRTGQLVHLHVYSNTHAHERMLTYVCFIKVATRVHEYLILLLPSNLRRNFTH